MKSNVALAALGLALCLGSGAQAQAPSTITYEGHELHKVPLGNLGRSAANATKVCAANGMRPLCGYVNSSSHCIGLGRGKVPGYSDWARGQLADWIGMPQMRDFLRGALLYGNNNWNGKDPANNLLNVTGASTGDWNYPTQTGGDVVCAKPLSGYSWKQSGFSVCNDACATKPYTITQAVTCESPTGPRAANESACAGEKPPATLACAGNPGCAYVWKSGEFPPCATHCGQTPSTLTRNVACFASTANDGRMYVDQACKDAGPKPAVTLACPATAACPANALKEVVFANLTFRKVNIGARAKSAASATAACKEAGMRPLCNYADPKMNHAGCLQWAAAGAPAGNFEWVYPNNWAKVPNMPAALKELFANSQFYGNNGTSSEGTNLLTNEGGRVNWAPSGSTGGDVICARS